MRNQQRLAKKLVAAAEGTYEPAMAYEELQARLDEGEATSRQLLGVTEGLHPASAGLRRSRTCAFGWLPAPGQKQAMAEAQAMLSKTIASREDDIAALKAQAADGRAVDVRTYRVDYERLK